MSKIPGGSRSRRCTVRQKWRRRFAGANAPPMNKRVLLCARVGRESCKASLNNRSAKNGGVGSCAIVLISVPGLRHLARRGERGERGMLRRFGTLRSCSLRLRCELGSYGRNPIARTSISFLCGSAERERRRSASHRALGRSGARVHALIDLPQID